MGLVSCSTPFWSGDQFIGPGAVYEDTDPIVVGREIYFTAIKVKKSDEKDKKVVEPKAPVKPEVPKLTEPKAPVKPTAPKPPETGGIRYLSPQAPKEGGK